jgi:hypothetical protein
VLAVSTVIIVDGLIAVVFVTGEDGAEIIMNNVK